MNNKTRKTYKKKQIKGGKTFKRMNCSPIVDNTPVKGSCFNKDVLQILKKAYNKHNKEMPIIVSNPVQIWKQLQKRLRTCNKEDCWLNEIDDKSLSKKLDEFIFSPDHPDDWNKNPHEWLSNFDIFDVLRQYMTKYRNFFATQPSPIDFDLKPTYMAGNCVSDELCNFNLEKHIKSGKTKFGIVFNISPHTSGGSHWVCLYIDTDDEFMFYMDSAGSKVRKQIKAFADRITEQGLAMNPPIKLHYYENCPLEHQMGSTECGMFCLYFIITMLSGKAEHKTFSNYVDKIKFFKDKRIPDSYVFKFRKIYFNNK